MPAFTTNILGRQIIPWLAAARAQVRDDRLEPEATGTRPQPGAATAPVLTPGPGGHA